MIPYKKVKDYEVGDTVDSFLLVKKVEVETSSNGKRFLDLQLCDKTGEINAKIWDNTSP